MSAGLGKGGKAEKGKGGGVGAALPLHSFLPLSCSCFLNFGDSNISAPSRSLEQFRGVTK